MALYAISNRQATERLEIVREQIDQSAQNGDINEREARWLQAILDDARNADWQSAAAAARRMMEDQVGR